MCEPNHSIVQYPEDRGDGNPTMTMLEPSIGKKILELGKKFWKWLHFSKLGTGHSEAIRALGSFSSLIPQEVRYEAQWWDRTVKLDGLWHGEAFDREPALAAATDYAKVVSIGSLTALRQFLDVSLRKTERIYLYTMYFLEQLLNQKGRDLANRKLKTTNINVCLIRGSLGRQLGGSQLESLIKVILGMTRRRDLLNDAWADDSSLWTPGQPGLLVPQQSPGIVSL